MLLTMSPNYKERREKREIASGRQAGAGGKGGWMGRQNHSSGFLFFSVENASGPGWWPAKHTFCKLSGALLLLGLEMRVGQSSKQKKTFRKHISLTARRRKLSQRENPSHSCQPWSMETLTHSSQLSGSFL